MSKSISLSPCVEINKATGANLIGENFRRWQCRDHPNSVQIFVLLFSILFSQQFRLYIFGLRSFPVSTISTCKQYQMLGGSPGLVVMGRDSHSEGCGFDSWYRILDVHFFTYICCNNCNVCLKRPKINEKEAVVGPFFFKKQYQMSILNHNIQTTSVPRFGRN